jgi:hypothetical protein
MSTLCSHTEKNVDRTSRQGSRSTLCSHTEKNVDRTSRQGSRSTLCSHTEKNVDRTSREGLSVDVVLVGRAWAIACGRSVAAAGVFSFGACASRR